MSKKDPYAARKREVQRFLAGARKNRKICTTKNVISKLHEEFPNVLFQRVGRVDLSRGLYMYKIQLKA